MILLLRQGQNTVMHLQAMDNIMLFGHKLPDGTCRQALPIQGILLIKGTEIFPLPPRGRGYGRGIIDATNKITVPDFLRAVDHFAGNKCFG